MHRAIFNLGCCRTAICKEQLPGFTLIIYHAGLAEIAIINIISCRIRISQNNIVHRLVNIHVIAVFLIYPHVINDKRTFRNVGIIVRISYPAAADCQIQY